MTTIHPYGTDSENYYLWLAIGMSDPGFRVLSIENGRFELAWEMRRLTLR